MAQSPGGRWGHGQWESGPRSSLRCSVGFGITFLLVLEAAANSQGCRKTSQGGSRKEGMQHPLSISFHSSLEKRLDDAQSKTTCEQGLGAG